MWDNKENKGLEKKNKNPINYSILSRGGEYRVIYKIFPISLKKKIG